MKLKTHQKILRKGMAAWRSGLRWASNPYGYFASNDEPSVARSWSWGWLRMERQARSSPSSPNGI